MKKVLLVLMVLALVAGGYWVLANRDTQPEKVAETHETHPTEQPTQPEQFQFAESKKSAHYVSNSPAHGTTLTAIPARIQLKFNFDLAPPSEINIRHSNGMSYSSGPTVISQDKLTLTREMDPNAPKGLYTVTYNACWPDRTCHEGNFQFGVN